MATLGTGDLTLADWMKRRDPDGKIAPVVEMLNLTNEILDDMTWQEGNLPTGHRTTVRTGLPTAAWRQLYQGVPPSKSRTAQVTDTCGMLEAYAETDCSLLSLGGNEAETRSSEDRAFLESMNQNFASTLIYGNTATTPERFLGLTARYNTSSAETWDNVLDAGGTGSTNTSIWLIGWGSQTSTGIFPKGSVAGFNMRDLGEHTTADANGGKFQVKRTHYKWDCGLTLRDWRYVVRIANVDVTQLTKNAASGTDLIDAMTDSLERIRDLNLGNPVFYMNRKVRSYLRRQLVNKTLQSTLSMETVAGKRVMMFGEVPVKRTDAILSTEAQVT